MAKININFNNTDYSIDNSSLSVATADLKSHLLNVMNGSGATITLDGITYNIDIAKLSAAEDDFASYLDTIGSETTEQERLEGDGAEYYTLAPTALSFRSTAPLNELQEIQINGVTVDPSNYTLEEGSTIVTFPIDYLKTLDVGNYEVDVVSESKSVKGGFTVVAPELNEHGFYYNAPYHDRIEYFGDTFVLVFNNDGRLNIININNFSTEECSWSIQDGVIHVHSSIGELECTIDNSEQISCEMLGSVFTIPNYVYMDKDWLYIIAGSTHVCMPLDKYKQRYLPIKSYVDGFKITSIIEQCFEDSQNIVEAPVLPDTLYYIGNSCFANCVNLASVSIPSVENILEIGAYAFENTSLEEIIIPNTIYDSVVYIEHCAFADCKKLRKVVFGCNVSIREKAFYNCTSLTTIIYEGTIAQWNAITKGDNWNYGVPATHVQCSDGQVAL